MAIRFVTDSGSDILPEEAEALGITCIPLLVRFGRDEYMDSVTLTHHQFYEKLVESDTLPITSQITPIRYTDVFEELTANGDEVVVVALSGALSGTYQSACVAASEFEGKVFVVDSQNVAVAQRILLYRGIELAEKGMSASEIAAQLDMDKKRLRVLAVLDTLEYLKKGGRISSAVAIAGSMLSIKPVVTVENGSVVMCGKARGSKNANNLLRKMVIEGPGIDKSMPYYAAYSGLSDAYLNKYIEDNADVWEGIERPRVASIGCAIGTHVGPGVIGVAFFENEK